MAMRNRSNEREVAECDMAPTKTCMPAEYRPSLKTRKTRKSRIALRTMPAFASCEAPPDARSHGRIFKAMEKLRVT